MTTQSETPVAVATAALADEAIGKIEKAGEGFARADADRSLSLHLFIGAVGEKPTFEQWESARKAAIVGYRRIKPASTDDAANVWWSRFVAAARVYAGEAGFDFALPTKPKSTSPEAQKKAEARKNPFDGLALDDARAKQKEIVASVSAAQSKGEIPAAPILEDMAKISETVVKLEREAGKLRIKAAKEKLAPRVDALKKRLNSADERFLTLAESLADALDLRNPESVREAAWDVLRRAMPSAKPATGAARKAA